MGSRFSHIGEMKKYLDLIGLIVGLTLFARQVRLSLNALYEYKLQIPWKAMLLSLGICICFYLLQVLSWTLIMKFLKAPIRVSQAIQGYTLSFLLRYIPGSIWGYWGRGQWLKRTLGISYRVSTLGSIIEIAAFVITAFIMGIGFLINIEGKSALESSIVVLMLIIPCWLIFMYIVLNKTLEEEKQRQCYIWVSKLKFAFRWLFLLLIYIVFWIFYGVAIGVIAQTIPDRLATTIACAAFAWIVGFVIIIIPGGLGIRETALVTLLNLTMGFPISQGNLVAVIFRAVNIFAELIWLLVGLLIYTLSK
jgi:hypothetical protein